MMEAPSCPKIVLLRNSTSLLPILNGLYLMGTASPVSISNSSPLAGTIRSSKEVAKTSDTASNICRACWRSFFEREGSIKSGLLSMACFSFAARTAKGATPSHGCRLCYFRKSYNSVSLSLGASFWSRRAAVPMSPVVCCGGSMLLTSGGGSMLLTSGPSNCAYDTSSASGHLGSFIASAVSSQVSG